MHRQLHLRALAFIQASLLLAMLVIPALAAAATIQTDLWVYQDGDTVTVTGVEFGANEIVDFVTTDPDGVVVDVGTTSSDELGNVIYAFTLHATIEGIYTVTGTGETSGLTALTEFDPASVTYTDLGSGPVGRHNGQAITFAGTFNCDNANPNKCTSVQSITIEIYQSNGTSGVFSDAPHRVASFAPSTPAAFPVAGVSTNAAWNVTKTIGSAPLNLPDGEYEVRAKMTYLDNASALQSAGDATNGNPGGAEFVIDNITPGAPTVTTVTPSPANNNAPLVGGTAEAGSTVTLYGNAACSGSVLGSGTASGGGAFSVTAVVANDTTTDFYATATDVASNVSSCSSTHVTYVEDSTSNPPVLTGSTPPSPGQNTSPLINGTAEAGATVALYKSSSCTGSHDDGTATGGAFSIAVSVGANSTTTFWGKATDLAGNVSACSSTSVTYNADNNGPSVAINSSPTNPTTSTSASFTFTATDAGANASGVASVECRLDSPTWGACTTSTSFSAVVGTGSHTFGVRATDNAGNVGNQTTDTWTVNVSDLTGPVITKNVTGSHGNNGWYTSDVTVTWTVTDAESTAVIDSGCVNQTLTAETAGTTLTCNAHSDGGTSSDSVTIMIDKTAPVITNTGPTSGPNGNGWYNADVTNGYSLDAGISGPDATCAANFPGNAQTKTTSGEGLDLTVTSDGCTDLAGNSANSVTSAGFDVDQTAPVISDTLATTSPNGAGWYNHDVTNGFSLNADISGPDATCAAAFPSNAQTQTTVGEGSALTVTSDGCTDLAGNTASGVTSAAFSVDETAPVISNLGPTTSPNGAGWYKTDVTNTFQAADALSGLGITCLSDFASVTHTQTKATSGEGLSIQTTSDPCADLADNSAAAIDSANFKIDLTSPYDVVFVGGGLTNGGIYYFGFVPAGPTSCTASDDLSAVKSCGLSGYSTAIGAHTVTATALDNADNSATNSLGYTVNAWTLKGFYQPVDMGNSVVNTVKNGSTVPFKFEIFAGPTELTSTTYVSSFTQTQVSCVAFNDVIVDAIEVTTTGGTTLRYDATAGQFIQNWQTPKKAGTCWVVTLTTDDGSTLSANFSLK